MNIIVFIMGIRLYFSIKVIIRYHHYFQGFMLIKLLEHSQYFDSAALYTNNKLDNF